MRRFRDEDRDAVDRLNVRLEAGGSSHRLFKEDLSKNPTADLAIRPVNDSLFVAVDGDEIRGGAWLREQYFWVDGARHRVGWIKYPVAESLVDPRFAGVPGSMVLQFLRHQPNLIALGMGGHDAPFARLLAGIGWKHSTIPLLIRIVRPSRVSRHLTYLRRRLPTRIAMDLAAWSGLAWAAHRLWELTGFRLTAASNIEATEEEDFASWADVVWEASRGGYGALAVRDSRTLRVQYPSSSSGTPLRITRDGQDVGWLYCEVLPKTPGLTRVFGDLNVVLITDALAEPSDVEPVLAAGLRHLEHTGADVVITYLAHDRWIAAARRLRFFRGPSRFAFYRSPKAEQLLVADRTLGARCHFTRSGEPMR